MGFYCDYQNRYDCWVIWINPILGRLHMNLYFLPSDKRWHNDENHHVYWDKSLEMADGHFQWQTVKLLEGMIWWFVWNEQIGNQANRVFVLMVFDGWVKCKLVIHRDWTKQIWGTDETLGISWSILQPTKRCDTSNMYMYIVVILWTIENAPFW